jgi:L-ascorbate metabolism protein UlaG (beta-lactamase superfamily)
LGFDLAPLERPRTGFDTIGNATIIAYDEGLPIVATDPWIEGPAYFGSWTFSHEIPEEQRRAILGCPFVWFSHGHPDHLNPGSIDLFKGKTILLPDHVGARIKKDLERMGHTTRVLPDREWVRLSPLVQVVCISDYYQDAILLLDINGRLLLDLNDALDRGWGGFVRRLVKKYEISFLLSLFGYGDADMINFRDDLGNLIPPKAAMKHPVGKSIAAVTASLGVTYFVPFSSMHRYQREDSIWAEAYVTGLEDYARGFASETCRILPAFLRYDCVTDRYAALNPRVNEVKIQSPQAFGDNWSDVLEPADVAQVRSYFGSIETLGRSIDFITLAVGGREHTVDLVRRRPRGGPRRGIHFEVPRGSLMTAVEYRIFDDLLIGNFMRTTLIGSWPQSKLYPDFIPYVARYADNANVLTEEALRRYFDEYKKRQPLEWFFHTIESRSVDLFRSKVQGGSPLFEAGKRGYWWIKGLKK